MPTPAPDLQTLLDYEGQILPAWIKILKAADITNVDQPFSQPRDSEGNLIPKSTPFVDVILSDVTPTGHQHPLPDGSASMWDAWQGTLACRVYTTRGVDSPQQARILATIRLVAQQCWQFFNSELLPYHRVGLLKEAGGGPGVDPVQRLDYTEQRFLIKFNVHPDAWPA
jgi:hypothetical protein